LYSEIRTKPLSLPKVKKGGWDMLEEKRSDIDRRCGEDRRRELYSREDNFRYFSTGGSERRSWKERRAEDERREDWWRVSKWSSFWVERLFEAPRF
jgi:hypothetical protein